MDKKKILIVCNGFYPENSPRSFRATELAKEFVREGHDVTVLTKQREEKAYEGLECGDKIKIKSFGKLQFPTIKISQNKIFHYPSRAFNRLLLLLFEYPSIEMMFKVKSALKKENGYDLLISIAVPYPIHWGTAWARTKKHRIAETWIADCGDPYMGCKTDSFKKLFYFKYVEKWFMRKTDYVSIPVESAKSAYYEEFHSKIWVIPQGFKIKPLNITQKSNVEILSFAYAGGFIPEIRDPRPFLEYLSNVEKDFRFYVFTNDASLIINYKNKLEEKLQIRSYIPREELLEFLSSMDFVVNFDNNTQAAVPSKLIDYMIVNKPILNIKKELETNTIQEFLKRNYQNAMKTGDIDKYRIENVCAQFLSLAGNE
jgi:hypothetical protein